MEKKTTLSHKFVTCLLLLALLSPTVSSLGCAWMSKDSKSPGLFSTKEKKNPRRPEKDPGVPQTVGDFLAMPRNDVL